MSKPTPDFTIDDMMTELGIVPVYKGPHAYTVSDLVERSGRGEGICREGAEENVKKELWIRVNVTREDRSKRMQCVTAYVNREVYEEHVNDDSRPDPIGISQENLG